MSDIRKSDTDGENEQHILEELSDTDINEVNGGFIFAKMESVDLLSTNTVEKMGWESGDPSLWLPYLQK